MLYQTALAGRFQRVGSSSRRTAASPRVRLFLTDVCFRRDGGHAAPVVVPRVAPDPLLELGAAAPEDLERRNDVSLPAAPAVRCGPPAASVGAACFTTRPRRRGRLSAFRRALHRCRLLWSARRLRRRRSAGAPRAPVPAPCIRFTWGMLFPSITYTQPLAVETSISPKRIHLIVLSLQLPVVVGPGAVAHAGVVALPSLASCCRRSVFFGLCNRNQAPEAPALPELHAARRCSSGVSASKGSARSSGS